MFCDTNVDPLGPSTDIRDDDVFRMLGDEANLDVDLFLQEYQERRYKRTCSSTFEIELRRRYPLHTLEVPTMTVADRLQDIIYSQRAFGRQNVADYLGFESFEIAYLMSDDNTKRDFLRLALNKWGSCSGRKDAASKEWENIIRQLFALGARFELLGHVEEKEASPEVVQGGIIRDEAVVEVIRQLVVEYFWGKMDLHICQGSVRDLVHGFEYFVSKTESHGIKLGASLSCRRFEVCLDSKFMVAEHGWWIPHEVSLFYDDGLSSWVMWDSTYETYCGEFWDMIDHPERTMPGT